MAGKLVKKDASASVPLGRDGALHRLRVLDVPGFRAPERQDLMTATATGQLRPSGRDAALQYWRDLGAKHKVMPEGP